MKPYTLGISIYGQFVLVPFSSNVSCNQLSWMASVFWFHTAAAALVCQPTF